MTNREKGGNRVLREGMRWLLALLIAGLSLTSISAQAAASLTASIPSASVPVGPTFGAHRETVDDLRVKVMGGFLRHTRSWDKGQWHFNRRWAPLKEIFGTGTQGPAGGGPVALNRADALYTWQSGDTYVHETNPRWTITKTASGYRWQNRRGDWLDYDTDSRATAYGDRNDVKVTLQYDAEGRLSGAFDHFDRQILWYEYQVDGTLSKVRDASLREVQYRYSGGQLSEVIDVRGKSWTYGYAGNRLKTKTNPRGRIVTISYGANGIVTSRLDQDGVGSYYKYEYDKTKREYYRQEKTAGGKLTETWFDREGDLIRRAIGGLTVKTIRKDGRRQIETDSVGNQSVKEYDAWDNLLKATYADGTSVSHQYDARFSGMTQKIDENGVITKWDYDTKGNLIRLTEAAGLSEQRITEYAYDVYGNRTEEKRLADAVTTETITRSTYDNNGNRKTLTDPEGQVTTYLAYDALGNPIETQDPRGFIWKRSYDAAGNLLSSTDPLNHTTSFTYDDGGNRITTTDARTHTTTYNYNLQDKRTRLTDPLTHATQYAYDTAGRLTTLTDPLGSTQTLAYDQQGRLIGQQDAAGNQILLGYGEGAGQGGGHTGATQYPGLLNRTQYPTYLQTYDYDQRNRRTRSIDHLGTGTAITLTEYDAAGNKTRTTDAEDRITQYRYDALNRLIEVIDPLNQGTLFGYDNRDNLISVTDPNGHTTRYSYDRADRKKSEIRPGGQTIAYDYDPDGNLNVTTDPDGRKTVNSYTDAGELYQQHYYAAGATTPERTVTYSYDANDNLAGWSDGSLSAGYQYDANNRKTEETTNYGPFSLTHRYTYDAAGNKKSYTGPDNVTVTYHWDKDRLSRIELPGEGSIVYNSYRWTQPAQITWPGGSTKQTSYDALMRPTQILTQDPGKNPTLDYRYTYDATGNIEQKTTQNKTYDYAYDLLQRLTQAATAAETEGWDYDPNGNRTADNLNPGTWQYDVNDRLLQSPVDTYTYDEAGNTISKATGGITTHYRYNAEGRLSRIEDANQNIIAEYRFDPLGRRIKKTTQTETLYFHYADEGLVGEYGSTGSPIRQYGFTPDSTWTTDPLYQKTDQGFAYYQNDHLGTPQQLIQKSGAKVWEGAYRAFGEVSVTNNAWENRLRYPGQYFDQETGNYYNYFRDYDPSTGRYIQSDPIGLRGGLNTYAYVAGNPLKYTDPDGLALCGGACTVGAIYMIVEGCKWALVRVTGLALGGIIYETVAEGENGECDSEQCNVNDDADYWEDKFPVEKDRKKNRKRRNKERSDKPKDPAERERRQRENEDRKRRTGRGGDIPTPTSDDW